MFEANDSQSFSYSFVIPFSGLPRGLDNQPASIPDLVGSAHILGRLLILPLVTPLSGIAIGAS
jgi:hypothetical protein